MFHDCKTSDFCWPFLEENMWILIKVLQKVLIWFVKESRIEDDLINQTSFFFFRNLVWEILFESMSKLYSWTWVNTGGVWYCCDLAVVVATYWKIEKKRGRGRKKYNNLHLLFILLKIFIDVCYPCTCCICACISVYIVLIINKFSCLGLWMVLDCLFVLEC